jgi:hypothetical protein
LSDLAGTVIDEVYTPGQLLLQVEVEIKEVNVKGQKKNVSILAIELVESGKESEPTDVLFITLLENTSIGKDFTLFRFDTDNTNLFFEEGENVL